MATNTPFIQETPHDPPRTTDFSAMEEGPGAHQDQYAATALLPNPVPNKEAYSDPSTIPDRESPQKKRQRRTCRRLCISFSALVVLILLIAIPVAVSSKSKQNQARQRQDTAIQTGTQTTTAGRSRPTAAVDITGSDGSTVKGEDGNTFMYNNKFGGFWFSDPDTPFSNNAQANSWTPPLNQTWTFGKDRIHGVNLGGAFVLEPFISPALYQKYPGAVDEWTLSTLMAADTANGGLDQIEHHYATFITEQDIAQIAGAGLNWVRVPIPFWAIETWPGEPFLAQKSWKYIVRLFGWCRKYGIRVYLDLHTIPGSQNGFNHSGRKGQINFLHGVMGMANAQRTLNYIRVITQFISQEEWRDVVVMFGIMNEAIPRTIGEDEMRAFYIEVHRVMRQVTGYGAGKGPYMSFHDGFLSLAPWPTFMRGADRVILDSHPYFAFNGGPATDPIATGTGPDAGGMWPRAACDRWANDFSHSRDAFGTTVAGEWSLGINDCGLYLNGVAEEKIVTYGGNCEDWMDSSKWDAATKAGILHFAKASMDSLGDNFFWTWKIGKSQRGIVESPLWSYQLGLEEGFMPTDPRTADGTCAALGVVPQQKFDGNYQPWMLGGVGAGAPEDGPRYTWPIEQVVDGGRTADLPQYAMTGPIVKLSMPTYTGSDGKAIATGDGWFNKDDKMGAPAPVPGCNYPDAWAAEGAAIPTGCTPGVGNAGAGDAGAAPGVGDAGAGPAIGPAGAAPAKRFSF